MKRKPKPAPKRLTKPASAAKLAKKLHDAEVEIAALRSRARWMNSELRKELQQDIASLRKEFGVDVAAMGLTISDGFDNIVNALKLVALGHFDDPQPGVGTELELREALRRRLAGEGPDTSEFGMTATEVVEAERKRKGAR